MLHAVDYGGAIPSSAHRCVVFLTSSQHRHEVVFTEKNLVGLEQWVEWLVRFYLHDRTAAARAATRRRLLTNRGFIDDVIKAVFDFERCLMHDGENDEHLNAQERHMVEVVKRTFAELERAPPVSGGGRRGKGKRRPRARGERRRRR